MGSRFGSDRCHCVSLCGFIHFKYVAAKIILGWLCETTTMSRNRDTCEVFRIGDQITVDIRNVAHGGHFIAHHSGQTIFVRGALEGERALVEVTAYRKKIYEARVVDILDASPMRVTPICPSSKYCGGCDFQHVAMTHQRVLKTSVLAHSLMKFAGIPQKEVHQLIGDGVQQIPGDNLDGSDWRTRARFVWQDGWHMHEYRSDRLTPTPECMVVTPAIREALNTSKPIVAGEDVTVCEGESGVTLVGSEMGIQGPAKVEHTKFGVTWRVKPTSFWQAHAGIIEQITSFIDSQEIVSVGQTWWDLYSGSGVFAAYLGNRVTATGGVVAVEGSKIATQSAKRALHTAPHIRVINAEVVEFVSERIRSGDLGELTAPAGIVLDPPRAGAGKDVCHKLLAVGAPIIVYIACDPVSLSRDLSFLARDYSVRSIAAWDAFPMSHHFESIAVLAKNLS